MAAVSDPEDAAIVAFISGWIAGKIISFDSPIHVLSCGNPIIDAGGVAYTLPLTLRSGRQVDIIVSARDD